MIENSFVAIFKRSLKKTSIAAIVATIVTLLSSSSIHSETELPANPIAQFQTPEWRSMNREEEADAWDYILDSPLGIAALNQLAIEGFISPVCEKRFYTNETYSGFQFLLRVQCPDERGVSSAIGYDEMRVIFNRFEASIENFEVERVGAEIEPTIPLPD